MRYLILTSGVSGWSASCAHNLPHFCTRMPEMPKDVIPFSCPKLLSRLPWGFRYGRYSKSIRPDECGRSKVQPGQLVLTPLRSLRSLSRGSTFPPIYGAKQDPNTQNQSASRWKIPRWYSFGFSVWMKLTGFPIQIPRVPCLDLPKPPWSLQEPKKSHISPMSMPISEHWRWRWIRHILCNPFIPSYPCYGFKKHLLRHFRGVYINNLISCSATYLISYSTLQFNALWTALLIQWIGQCGREFLK